MTAQNEKFRKIWTLVLGMALAIAAGNMACGETINDLDNSDETEGAT